MLDRNTFAVKEKVKFLKSHQSYDIFDADTQELLGTAEEQISGLKKFLRWFVSKALMSTKIEIEDENGTLLFTISRGWYVFRARVEVHDASGKLLGYFKSKVMTIGGGFHIYTEDNTHFGEVKGNLIGFKYRILTPDHSVELGKVSKQWGGLAKEFFTSADTYRVEINPDLQSQQFSKILVLAAALATDMVFKSESKTGGNSLLDGFGD